jgi:hypothetical protein
MSIETKEFQLLRAVTKQRLMKTLQAGENLACSNLLSVDINDRVVSACSS